VRAPLAEEEEEDEEEEEEEEAEPFPAWRLPAPARGAR
jgi:hypothetical protein